MDGSATPTIETSSPSRKSTPQRRISAPQRRASQRGAAWGERWFTASTIHAYASNAYAEDVIANFDAARYNGRRDDPACSRRQWALRRPEGFPDGTLTRRGVARAPLPPRSLRLRAGSRAGGQPRPRDERVRGAGPAGVGGAQGRAGAGRR